MSAVAVRTQRANEEMARAHEEKVAKATVDQIAFKFEADLKILKDHTPAAESAAKEAALDAKYLAQRQLIL